MKKLILMALITISTVAYAQVKIDRAYKSPHEARTALEAKREYTDYMNALKSGKAMAENMKRAFQDMMHKSIEAANLKGINSEGINSMLDILPDSATKVVELLSLAQHGTAEQKIKATLDLKIISEGSTQINSSTKEGILEAEALIQVTEMADYNQNAKNFKSKLAKNLKNNMTVTKAVEDASDGKITLEKIKNCAI